MSLYWRVVTFGTVAAALAGLVWAAASVELDYARAVPIRTVDALGNPREVAGAGRTWVFLYPSDVTYPTSGSMLSTEAGYTYDWWGFPQVHATLVDLFSAWLDPNTDVVEPTADLEPWADPPTTGEIGEATPRLVAEYLARSAAGERTQAQVVVVRDAGHLLDPPLEGDDVIRSVAGVPVTGVDSFRAAMATVSAPDVVEVTVYRGASPRVLRVATTKGPDGAAALPFAVAARYLRPGESWADVPSWGRFEPDVLMLGLGTYDRLTPGELTGGKSIAGAGTLDERGQVGPVDFVPQKMAGARQAGAEYFLTGAQNCPQAQERRPPGMTVVKVETFDEAREAVASIGRGETASLPHC